MGDKAINYAADRKYVDTHEWAKQEGDLVVVGISDYAQDQLGDIVFVELPTVGGTVEAGKCFATIESVKAASDVFSPISGKVEAVNDQLANAPELVNKDALGEGWMMRVRPNNMADLGKLMDAATYQKKIETKEIH